MVHLHKLVVNSNTSSDTSTDILTRADRARDAKDWRLAQILYGEYLNRTPADAAIWVQYGHACKESGDIRTAESAYNRSLTLAPDVADTYLQLGHALKLQGEIDRARDAYDQALKLAPSDLDAQREVDAIARPSVFSGDVLSGPSPKKPRNVFDCSDLIHYLRDNRLPTGIQRVQINIIRSLITSEHFSSGVAVAFYDLEGRQWLEISQLDFQRLIAAAQQIDTVPDFTWQSIRNQICGRSAPTFLFKLNDKVINLGTSWWIPDYFLMIRNLKQTYKIHYIPFIHDCIPLITPEYCAEGLVIEFRDWITNVFQHSDSYLVNSSSTACDLVRTADEFGFQIPDPTVIRLDGDTRTAGQFSDSVESSRDLSDILLSERVPANSPFVLMVSTLEARKNHILALNVWSQLCTTRGEDKTPYLICVGKPGWRFETVGEFLLAHQRLKGRVRFISNLSDAVLAELYSRCLFTIYPSHYEGWGLPVTESLCYGKTGVVARNSSLPEAGCDFVDYFEPGAIREAKAKIERLIDDHDYRAARERQVAEQFKPRLWTEVARDVVDAVGTMRHEGDIPDTSGLTQLTPGVIHHMVSQSNLPLARLYAGGQNLRVGQGWHRCEPWGVWSSGQEARLMGRLPGRSLNDCLLYLYVRGNPIREMRLSVSCPELDKDAAFDLPASSEVGVMLPIGDIPEQLEAINILLSTGHPVDLGQHASGSDNRTIGIGLCWVAVCERGDALGRLSVAEALQFKQPSPGTWH